MRVWAHCGCPSVESHGHNRNCSEWVCPSCAEWKRSFEILQQSVIQRDEINTLLGERIAKLEKVVGAAEKCIEYGISWSDSTWNIPEDEIMALRFALAALKEG